MAHAPPKKLLRALSKYEGFCHNIRVLSDWVESSCIPLLVQSIALSFLYLESRAPILGANYKPRDLQLCLSCNTPP
jgi:hypothetical protein